MQNQNIGYNEIEILREEIKTLNCIIKEFRKFEGDRTEAKSCVSMVEPNYEEEYYRKSEQIKELQQEVENYKKALINIALKL